MTVWYPLSSMVAHILLTHNDPATYFYGEVIYYAATRRAVELIDVVILAEPTADLPHERFSVPTSPLCKIL